MPCARGCGGWDSSGLRFFSALLLPFLLLPGRPPHAANDLYATLNRQRAGHGDCAPARQLPPLEQQAALERAARDLAQGRDLKQSLADHGYRAARTRTLSIKGDGVGAQAAAILARQRYCAALQEADLTQAGIYVDGRQLWLVMAAPFAPTVPMTEAAAGLRVLELVNRARATPRLCGAKAFKAARPVRWNAVLAEASRLHAADMARHNYFSHGGRDGSDPGQRVERAGYRYRAIGENIAAGGQMQAEEAVAGWITSPGHCVNLMNPAFTEMGAAYAIDAGSDMGIYWAQAFGTPR